MGKTTYEDVNDNERFLFFQRLLFTSLTPPVGAGKRQVDTYNDFLV